MNFVINKCGQISDQFLQIGIDNFIDACEFVRHLPYRRNANKNDIICIFNDKYGTCSTKHATLRLLALENNHPEVKLILGIIMMDAAYAPAIARTLAHAQLDHIPEAHNYLKINNEYLDCTSPQSDYSSFRHLVVDEYEMEYDQISNQKVSLHQAFLFDWAARHTQFTAEEIWAIREQCIKDLQNQHHILPNT